MARKWQILFYFFYFVFHFSFLDAQEKKHDSAATGFIIQFSYAAQLPAGNLAQEFGFNSNVAGGVLYKTKSNWLFGIQGAFIFGNQIKETDILDNIATPDGNIIGNDGLYPQITYFERGYDVQLSVGKLFPLSSNLNSGILVMGSAGYLRHKILIEIQNGEYTPQLTGDYLDGYDQLTAGPCATEFVGYMYLGENHILNFFAGFESTQGFTKCLRFDFATMSQNTNLRYDLLNGIRVGWILPIYVIENDSKFYTH